MNENYAVKSGSGMDAPQKESQTRIYEFISEIETHQREFDCILDASLDVVYRVDQIANRLNSLSYPKNFPKDGSAKSVLTDLSPKPDTDGMVSAFERLLEENKRLLRRFNQDLLPSLKEGVTYLEQHI